MLGNEDRLYAEIGRMTMALRTERGEKQQVIGLLRAVCDGSIDPLRVTFTDTGVQVAGIEDDGAAKAGDATGLSVQ